jgi:hypothetical protein
VVCGGAWYKVIFLSVKLLAEVDEYRYIIVCSSGRENTVFAVVLSQVQATTTPTSAQPVKVPQFVPPPRLTPRPTFQPQVRPSKTRPLTLIPTNKDFLLY